MERKTKSLLTLLLTFVLAMALALGLGVLTGCGGGSSSSVTVTLNKTEAEIIVDDSTTLIATVSDSSYTVEWSTSDSSVATVRNGKVTGVKAGTATITATAGTATATCTVTVVDVTVTISQTSATIDKGATLQLTATASRDDYVIAWSSSDTSVATVDSNGLVKALTKGTATITATFGTTSYSASCAVTVDWTEPEGYTVVNFGEESTTLGDNIDTWVYWNDQNWCGSYVTAIEAYSTTSEGIYFVYSGVTTSCWFGYQIFYTDSTLTDGQYYKITLVINSESAGDITINGTVVSLIAGDNTVVLYKTAASGSSTISMQMGVSNGNGYEATSVIESNTFVIKSYTAEAYTAIQLATPTALAITTAGVVTFTDSNTEGTVDGYLLTFYKNETAQYTYTITNGGTIDNSEHINATYSVTIQAVGSGAYCSSAESAAVEYTVSDGLEVLIAPTAISIATDGTVTITDGNATTEHVTGYIVYLKANGITYLTATIANGDKIDTYYLEDKDYTVSVVAVGDSQYANSDEYVSATTYNPGNGTVSYEFTASQGESVATATPGIWVAWANSDNSGAASLTSISYNGGTITLVATTDSSEWYSIQVFYKNPELTEGKTYTLTLNLNSTSAGTITINGTVVTLVAGDNEITISYTEGSGASFSMQVGSSADGVDISSVNFTLTNVKWELEYTIAHGDEGTALANTDTVYVWYLGDYNYSGDWGAVENDDVTASYKGGTITWTIAKNDYGDDYTWANQLFYKNSSLTAGTTYKLTMTINSTTAGSITVNGQTVELVVGDNTVTVEYVEGSDSNGICSIDIQLGVSGITPSLTGTLVISNYSWEVVSAS